MSALLGCNPAQYNRWEQGIARISWTRFCRICHCLNIELPRILIELFCYSEPVEEGARLLRHLMVLHGLSARKVASALGRSETHVDGLLNGSKTLRLDQVLLFLRELTDLFPDFIGRLMGEGSDPIAEEYRAKREKIEFESQHPVAILASLCTELDRYARNPRHQPGFLSRELGISRRQEAMLARQLTERTLLKTEGGRLKKKREKTDTSGDFIRSSRAAKFWTRLALERFQGLDGTPIPSARNTNVLAHRAFAVSKQGEEKVVKAFLEFYGKVSEILRKDSLHEKETIKLLLFHFFEPQEVLKTRAGARLVEDQAD